MVTFVVAAYNRPDPLRVTLRSVQAQDESGWRVLVVGDACGPEIEAVVESFKEPRFKYVNLPWRMGEQAGPNSVGLALAETEYVAFLNHDDVLLSDHLSVALETMRVEQTDFFVGRAAWAWEEEPDPVHGQVPIFQWATPVGRRPVDIFLRPFYVFEPCSAWVLRRNLAQRIGPWRSSLQTYRPPIQDWLMRAWRVGSRFSFDAPITVLKMNTHHRHKKQTDWYTGAGTSSAWLTSTLAREPEATRRDFAATVRARPIERDIRFVHPAPQNRIDRAVYAVLVNPLTAWMYHQIGWDGFGTYRALKVVTYQALKGRRPERMGARASAKRTGFDLGEAPAIPQAVRHMVEHHGPILWSS